MKSVNYDKNDPNSIQALFTNIAQSYDKTNAILSFQMHHRWNRLLVERAVSPHHPQCYLDLCSGTGEIAFTYLKQAQHPCTAFLLDFSEGMLKCAQKKAEKLSLSFNHSLNFIQADAQSIPLDQGTVDCASMAYGIRNIKDPGASMAEVLRVLKPGGIWGILELTQPSHPLLKIGHSLYLRTLVPLLGYCFSANQEAYQYLCNSIHSFIKPQKLKQQLMETGFGEVEILPLSGGISTILIAKKPF